MRNVRLVVLAAVIVMATATALPGTAATSTTYTAPYAAGPTGPPQTADRFNVVMADTTTGTVTLARANPVPGVINCPGSGPYANFVVRHTVTEPITSVRVAYAKAAFDNFTFLRVALTDGSGEPIGFQEVQGPMIASSGETILHVGSSSWWQSPAVGDTIAVTFGLNMSSGCIPGQSADAGTISFPSVTVE